MHVIIRDFFAPQCGICKYPGISYSQGNMWYSCSLCHNYQTRGQTKGEKEPPNLQYLNFFCMACPATSQQKKSATSTLCEFPHFSLSYFANSKRVKEWISQNPFGQILCFAIPHRWNIKAWQRFSICFCQWCEPSVVFIMNFMIFLSSTHMRGCHPFIFFLVFVLIFLSSICRYFSSFVFTAAGGCCVGPSGPAAAIAGNGAFRVGRVLVALGIHPFQMPPVGCYFGEIKTCNFLSTRFYFFSPPDAQTWILGFTAGPGIQNFVLTWNCLVRATVCTISFRYPLFFLGIRKSIISQATCLVFGQGEAHFIAWGLICKKSPCRAFAQFCPSFDIFEVQVGWLKQKRPLFWKCYFISQMYDLDLNYLWN